MSEKGERMKAILGKVVKALQEGRDPFHTEFLSENEITLDECFGMSEKMAAVINGYLNAPKELQMKILMAHAVEGTGLPFEIFEHQMNRDAALRKLHDVSDKVAKKIKKL